MKNTFMVISLGAFVISAAGSQAFGADVEGFRSAKFGENEKDVIRAVMLDLRITEKDIRKQQDPATKVTVLSANANGFEPLGFSATVSYVLGYKCRCLTQVSVQWEYPKDVTPAQRGTAINGVASLVNHFQNRGWGQEEAIVNRLWGQSKDGGEGAIVFFRGQNARGGAITLLGAPVKISKDNDKPENVNVDVDTLQAVSVIYEKDAKNPDVKRVEVSGF